MSCRFRGAAIAVALATAVSAAVPAMAQESRVKIAYDEPANPDLRGVYQRLKGRHVLEEFREFLSALHLPHDITIRTAQCGSAGATYKSGGPVTICYEVMDRVEKIVAAHTSNTQYQQQIVVGAFIQYALHQTAYAIFDVLDVPIWGREFDAADRLAALIMMQFGDEISNTAMLGTIQLFAWSNQSWTGSAFANASSPDFQRFYNYACIAAAANYLNFHGLITNKFIPEHRAARCTREYNQIRKAFDLRIMPYVDPDKLIALRTRRWLNASSPQ
jgi:Putative metallopeptidase